MAARKERVKSAFSGASPVVPVVEPTTVGNASQAPPEKWAEMIKPQHDPAPKKIKTGYYNLPTNAERIRGAFMAVGREEQHRSFSDFHEAVMLREVERLEVKYNNGKPFPSAPPRSGALGRPMG